MFRELQLPRMLCHESSILFGYLCMQAARHSQGIENTVFMFGNRASPSEK